MQQARYEIAQDEPLYRNELVLSFAAIAAITSIYLLVVILMGVPQASGLIGHSLGILGFLLMLATEILYTLRKRYGSGRWGRTSDWLKFHIFTGLVGPYLVFLHTAWDFNGLAGVTMLLTGIVVASGFVGRFIYTYLPRTAEGALLEAEQGDRLSRPAIQAELQTATLSTARRAFSLWHALHVPLALVMFAMAFIHIGAAVYYATLFR